MARCAFAAALLAVAGNTPVVFADFMAVNFTDTPSPNAPIEKPRCNATVTISVLYAEGSITVDSADGASRGGCITVDQVWEARGGRAPLYAVDPETGEVSEEVTGTWLLTGSMNIQGGVTLQVG